MTVSWIREMLGVDCQWSDDEIQGVLNSLDGDIERAVIELLEKPSFSEDMEIVWKSNLEQEDMEYMHFLQQLQEEDDNIMPWKKQEKQDNGPKQDHDNSSILQDLFPTVSRDVLRSILENFEDNVQQAADFLSSAEMPPSYAEIAKKTTVQQSKYGDVQGEAIPRLQKAFPQTNNKDIEATYHMVDNCEHAAYAVLQNSTSEMKKWSSMAYVPDSDQVDYCTTAPMSLEPVTKLRSSLDLKQRELSALYTDIRTQRTHCRQRQSQRRDAVDALRHELKSIRHSIAAVVFERNERNLLDGLPIDLHRLTLKEVFPLISHCTTFCISHKIPRLNFICGVGKHTHASQGPRLLPIVSAYFERQGYICHTVDGIIDVRLQKRKSPLKKKSHSLW